MGGPAAPSFEGSGKEQMNAVSKLDGKLRGKYSPLAS
jgi:hypothetical protein